MNIDDNISEADFMFDPADEIIDDTETTAFIDTRKAARNLGRKTLYRCTRCGQYKPKSEFYLDKRVPCGMRSKCKICYHKVKRNT